MHIVDCLPDEILVKIFSKLTIVELVDNIRITCRRWRSLSREPSLWKEVDAREHLVYRQDVMNAIRKSACYINALKLSENGCATHLNKIYFPNLRRLELGHALPLTGKSVLGPADDIAKLFSAYSFLEHLSIVSYYPEFGVYCLQHITLLKHLRHLEIRIQAFPEDYALTLSIDTLASFPMLTTLILDCSPLQDSFINAIFNGFSLLKKLVLNCENLTINAFRDMPGRGIALEHLTLDFARSLTDDDYIYIFGNSPNLLSIHVFCPNNITEKSIVHSAFACSNLESLKITFASFTRPLKITSVGMNAIADNCPNLRVIDFDESYTTVDFNMDYLAKRCPKLEQLVFSSCRVAIESIRSLSMKAANLRVLKLRNNDSITGTDVSQIVTKCQHLNTLDLSGCCNVINLCFDEFHQQKTQYGQEPLTTCNASCFRVELQLPTAVQLKENRGQLCSVDHDTHLERRPMHSHLQIIRAYLTSLSNCSYKQIAKHCPDLRVLETLGRKIQDDAAEALVKNCHFLKTLQLSGEDLTDVGLSSIAEFGSNLEVFSISRGRLGTIQSKDELKSMCQTLSYSYNCFSCFSCCSCMQSNRKLL